MATKKPTKGKKKDEVEVADRTKLSAKFTRYMTRNAKETVAEGGMLAEKHAIKTKSYDVDETHSTKENSNSYPLVIVKLRGRGYTVVDVARDTFYVSSEVKLNEKCTVYCHNSNSRKKGYFFFDTDKRPGLPVKDEKGNLVLIQQDGILRRKYRDDKTKEVRTEENPIPAGFVYTVTC